MQEGKTKKVLAEINMGSSVYSTPVPANGVLYISNRNQLYALAEPAAPKPTTCAQMRSFDFQPRTRVVFGAGMIDRLGELARELSFKRTLLVADHGLVASGHVDEAVGPLQEAGVEVFRFHDFEVNPDTRMIEAGTTFALIYKIDSIIGLGGGSSLDCAKGINFLLTNGGRMSDYHGYGKATKPMLPMIAIPTTAGTGSEAQTYALISDAETHVKMACGDPKASFRVALLDPALTVSQPRSITATSGFDAIAHAVETFVTTKRNPTLRNLFARSVAIYSSQITNECSVNPTISKREARCSWEHFMPAWLSRIRCSARRMPAPIR